MKSGKSGETFYAHGWAQRASIDGLAAVVNVQTCFRVAWLVSTRRASLSAQKHSLNSYQFGLYSLIAAYCHSSDFIQDLPFY